jgi:flagellar hook-associated protein 2
VTAQSNTITEASSAIPGLTVTALKVGATTVEVSTDTGKIKTAITEFITEYNKAQSLISTHTASSTDADGKVTAGILAADRDANDLASTLRKMVNAVVSGVSGSLTQLASIGINSNGNDDTLALTDSAKLDAALASNLNGVAEVFSSANGIAKTVASYLEKTIGEEGTLVDKRDNLTLQASNIDTQIAELERVVLSNRERMIASFVAMERAQARINQQMQFLMQKFGTG